MQVMTQAPERSTRQRLEALELANHVRIARAQVKRDVKARRVSAAVLLLDPPPEVESMKVLTLLLAVPKVGRVKAQKILRQQEVSPSKTIGGLSVRQRRELALRLGPVSVRLEGTMEA